MIESLIFPKIHYGAGTACFRIKSTENDTFDTRLYNSARAHWARLERHIQCAVFKTPAADGLIGLLNGNQLRMRQCFLPRFADVVSCSDDLAIVNNDCAARNLTVFACVYRLIDRFLNEYYIGHI